MGMLTTQREPLFNEPLKDVPIASIILCRALQQQAVEQTDALSVASLA